MLKKIMGLMLVGVVLMAINPAKIQKINVDEGPVVAWVKGGPKPTPNDTVGAVPDVRAALGPGRNIAVKGDTVVVIWGPPSGDPNNIFSGVKIGYSFDGGHTYTAFDVSTNVVRRVYPGLYWADGWYRPGPVWVWQEGPSGYPYMKAFVGWDAMWPMGLLTFVELPRFGDEQCWEPVIIAKKDTAIVTAVDIFTGYSYVWVSYDTGNTWVEDTLGDYADVPIIRWGPGNIVYGITHRVHTFPWGDAYVPYFLLMHLEDSGLVVDQEVNLWDEIFGSGNAPYDSCAGGWWYVYSMTVSPSDNWRPHIAWKWGIGTYEFGDVWYIRPTSGDPYTGWSGWEAQCMVGFANGATVATQPMISMLVTPAHDTALIINYLAYFIVGPETLPQIGFLISTDWGNTWIDTMWSPLDSMYEEAWEQPAQVYFTDRWLHLSGIDDRDNPQWMLHGSFYIEEAVKEFVPVISSGLKVRYSYLNNGAVKISFALNKPSNIKVSAYDVSGRLVKMLYSGVAKSKDIIFRPSAKGVYVIKVETGKVAKTFKVVTF